MTRGEEQAYLEELALRGSRPGLETVSRLAEALGHPEEAVPVVHITGTNGKGSVLAYVSTILGEAGYRVGRFFSPAMSEQRTAVQFGGRPMSKKDFGEFLSLARAAEEEGGFTPTLFEVMTVAAFWYFKKKGCDIAVVECGMGGAKDATNIVPAPLVCVFTPISFDHTAWLGKTLSDIAAEKSGIIKDGTIVCSAQQEEEAAAPIRKAAAAHSAELRLSAQPARVRESLKGCRFDCAGYKDMKINLAGYYQPENAALALLVTAALSECGFPVSEKALRKGLSETEWFGRFTVLRTKPYLIADGAHNIRGAEVLAESLKQHFADKGVILLMGVLKDKDYTEMLKILLPYAVHLVTRTPPENARALPGQLLAEAATEISALPVTSADSVEEGLEVATLLSGGRYPIIACGSLSWLERLRIAAEKENKDHGR